MLRYITILCVVMALNGDLNADDVTVDVNVSHLEISDDAAWAAYSAMVDVPDSVIKIRLSADNSIDVLSQSMVVLKENSIYDQQNFQVRVIAEEADSKKEINYLIRVRDKGNYTVEFQQVGFWKLLTENAVGYRVQGNTATATITIKNAALYSLNAGTPISLALQSKPFIKDFEVPNDNRFDAGGSFSIDFDLPLTNAPAYMVSDADFKSGTANAKFQIVLNPKNWPENYPGVLTFVDENRQRIGRPSSPAKDVAAWQAFLKGSSFAVPGVSPITITLKSKTLSIESETSVDDLHRTQMTKWTGVEHRIYSNPSKFPVSLVISGTSRVLAPENDQNAVDVQVSGELQLSIVPGGGTVSRVGQQVTALNSALTSWNNPPETLKRTLAELKRVLATLTNAASIKDGILNGTNAVAGGAPVPAEISDKDRAILNWFERFCDSTIAAYNLGLALERNEKTAFVTAQ